MVWTKEKQDTYWAVNKDKYNRRARDRWKNDAEFRRKRTEEKKKWERENPIKYKAQRERARAKDKQRRLRTRFLVLVKNDFSCAYCGRRPPEIKLEVDHVNPRAKGGKDLIENYIAACSECNIGKSDAILKEFNK